MRPIDADGLIERKFVAAADRKDPYSTGWNDCIDAIMENEPTIPPDAMSAVHELKIQPKYYLPVAAGTKNFEIRKNDRDYHTGDDLILREYDKGLYTGRHVRRKVRYVLENCPEYGLKDGFCILGF